jgi:hypothetical protein
MKDENVAAMQLSLAFRMKKYELYIYLGRYGEFGKELQTWLNGCLESSVILAVIIANNTK